MSQIRLALSLAVLPLLFALSLRGDTIELKTGERIEGAFKQANSAGAVIEVAGQPITIPLEKIRAIYFGAAASAIVAGPAPSQEALDALKALRSVTDSGIAYRDYSQRVLNAKVKVDQYLSTASDDITPLRSAIGLAMREYELASQAWSGAITTSGVALISVGRSIEQDSRISDCPAIREMIDQVDQNPNRRLRPTSPAARTDSIGIRAGLRPALLWACASAQLAEAERLVAQH
jgi:hypothetical protein